MIIANMQRLVNFILSPIGAKIIMALSGALIILFLLGHVLGNLLIFNGQQSLNTYAHWLQNNPFLWIFRLSMIVLLVLHIFIALRLAHQNKLARPIDYEVKKSIQLGLSEKTMILSGALIFAFIIFHIAHLSLGLIPPSSLEALDSRQMLDVYTNVVSSFQQPIITIIYILSILVIGLHLYHSLKSLFQTLGFHHENFHLVLNALSPILIIALIVAFISIPIAVLSGMIS